MEPDRDFSFRTGGFQLALDSVPVPIVMVNPTGTIVLMNPEAARLFGYCPEELLGRPIEILVPEASRSSHTVFRESFGQHPRVRSIGSGRDLLAQRKDGSRFPVEIGLNPVLTAEGPCVLASVVDITERKRSEQEALARQKLENLGVMARGVAHDFNNLMGSILIETEDLLAGLAPESSEFQAAVRIKTISVRAAEIVRELMGYAKEENTLFEPLDLSRLIRDMFQLFQVSISKRAVLRVDVPQGLPLIRANASQILQLLMNLIINASEAIGETDGVITISTSVVAPGRLAKDPDLTSAREYLRLTISDTGCGMTDEVKTRIFDPFFTTKASGRGLGLASVEGVVHRHGGAIHVTSSPGQGTRFEILLPCMAQAATTSAESLSSPFVSSGNDQKTVLVVEDEDSLRAAVAKVLRRKGFSVIEAPDGKIAIELFRSANSPVQAVLLDVTLPGMSGNVVLEHLRQIQPAVKGILTSAYTEEMAVKMFGSHTAWAFLRKPYHLGELVDLIRHACSTENSMEGGGAGS